ncbi:hypothetical protein [Phreatobacter sp. AB_2022a]|uniref:hypothetical protein n=1 Tax=Phreatobacter sp. AB_2022a TaxID=3003134 RepID=UPI002286F855|nr:hypothetical protein [Phreatobacter sp. AB_2022a]MCZ0734396.1 hypothetical protein [Phreatobacter sp. AB_2022a]
MDSQFKLKPSDDDGPYDWDWDGGGGDGPPRPNGALTMIPNRQGRIRNQILVGKKSQRVVMAGGRAAKGQQNSI